MSRGFTQRVTDSTPWHRVVALGFVALGMATRGMVAKGSRTGYSHSGRGHKRYGYTAEICIGERPPRESRTGKVRLKNCTGDGCASKLHWGWSHWEVKVALGISDTGDIVRISCKSNFKTNKCLNYGSSNPRSPLLLALELRKVHELLRKCRSCPLKTVP